MVERDPARLRGIFLRLGEIYSSRVPDPKRAAAAFERVLGVDADNLEALRALSELTVAEGDIKRALPVTEKLVAQEPDLARRHRTRIRLGELLMQTGDLRRAAVELRRVVDESPRDLAAIGALAQLLDRARDQAGRRSVLDRAVRLQRQDLDRDAGGGLQAGDVALSGDVADHARAPPRRRWPQLSWSPPWAVGRRRAFGPASRPGRSLAALATSGGRRSDLLVGGAAARDPAAPAAARAAAPPERAGAGAAARAARASPRPTAGHGARRLGRCSTPSRLSWASATSTSTSDGAPRPTGPTPLRAEPGNPPAIIIGAPLEELGPGALRFAAARTLRLASTNLDAILAGSPEEAGALLVGIIRQFVPDYEHKGVRESLIELEMARAERAIPRKLKPQVMPFAVESAGAFDLGALYDGHARRGQRGRPAGGRRSSGGAVGDPGDLRDGPAGEEAGRTGGAGLTLEALGANPEAMALLQFAVSDEFDELARELES